MQGLWPALSAVLAAIAAGALGYLGGLRQLEVQAQRQQKNLANSIAAEIEAYLAIVRRRQQPEHVERIVKLLEAGRDVQFPRLLSPEDTPFQFPVLSALLARIGELGPVAGDVAQFYTLASGVRSTLIAGARGHFDDMAPKEKAELLRGELAVWGEVEQLGEILVPKLRNFGARP